MVYPTVSINGNDYSVYGDLEGAELYLGASVTATAWALQTSDDAKGRDLVSAVRWLEQLAWLGAKADDEQALAWPRSGIAGVDDSSIPTPIINASFELASQLEDDPTLYTSLSDPLIQSMAAGPVNISFFRPHDVYWKGVVPKAVLALIRPYLDSGNAAGGPTPIGVSDETTLDDDYGFSHGV